jgi:UDP-2-acetamido-3-amino-2,3-dideoxy-glucuronate N-acetyltransferase
MENKAFFAHNSAIIDDGAKIGKNTKVWHFSHIMPNAVIGENCRLGQNVFIANNVTIGNNVKIQNNVSVYEGVELGDDVFCGPSVVFTNVKNPRSAFPRNTSSHYTETVIKKGASLGANSTIVCGITIEEWAFVAAGAVVTKDVPRYALAAGVPAKRTGWVCKCGEMLVVNDDRSVCSTCQRRYKVQNTNVLVCEEKEGDV